MSPIDPEKPEGPVMIPAAVGNTIFRDKERLERENARLRAALESLLVACDRFKISLGLWPDYLDSALAAARETLKEQP